MNISTIPAASSALMQQQLQSTPAIPNELKSATFELSGAEGQPSTSDKEFRETFNQFVGQTFFGQLMASMRKSVGKSDLLHGGRGEEIFQSKMDQIVVEKMSEATADQIANPMFELLNQQMIHRQ